MFRKQKSQGEFVWKDNFLNLMTLKIGIKRGGGGNLGAGGSPTPEPYIPSRFVLSKKLDDLKAQMNEKESLLEDKYNKLVEVGTLLEQKEDQIGILQKKRAGEKSGHVRMKRSKIQEKITPINEIPVEVCDGNDYISITERLTGCGNIFGGKEIFGSKSGKKQTGRDCVGVRFFGSGASRPLNSSLTTKALDSRLNLALQVLALISGDSWEKVQGGGMLITMN